MKEKNPRSEQHRHIEITVYSRDYEPPKGFSYRGSSGKFGKKEKFHYNNEEEEIRGWLYGK